MIFKKQILFFILLITIKATVAQVSGLVYRDYNGNGTRQNTANVFVEPGVIGIIVNAYNSADVLIATQTTTANGTYAFPASGLNAIPNGTSVRMEFIMPNTSTCGFSGKNYASFNGSGNGTAVQFVTAGAAATNLNFAINSPEQFVFDAAPFSNTYFYQALNVFGNPTASPSGTAANQMAFVKFPYNRAGTTAIQSSEILARFSQIGSVYGVAYSRQAKKIFTAAYMKRHSGFGPADGVTNHAPGAIYIIDPTKTAATGAATYFTSLDALGYPTHNYTGTPVYGNGTSYNITIPVAGTAPNWFARQERINYLGAGAGVIGTNVQRGLNKDSSVATNDPAAYDQIGKVSLGDIEISDDGLYLFVTNLFDRKVYQLQLNNAYNPSSATVVTSWSLPNPPLRSTSGILNAASTYSGANDNTDFYTGARGLQRPFGLKYYNNKLYIGAVTTAEGASGQTTTDNNTGNPEYTDLWAYVWELNPITGFNTSPVLHFPLNFNRLLDADGIVETFNKWTNTMPAVSAVFFGFPQPVFSGIEFDIDGSMIVSFRDRIGDQAGTANHMLLDNRTSRTVEAYGDIFRAYKNTACSGWIIESNGDKDGPGPYVATTAQKNGQGPSNYAGSSGEFYYQDGIEVWNGVITWQTYHLNTNQGSLAIIQGTEEIAGTVMDPTEYVTGGISWYNNNTGANPRDYQVYTGTSYNVNPGEPAKGNGMGDMELLTELPTVELGNRIWNDANGDGIQNANELGIGNVVLELFVDNNNDGIVDGAAIGTTTSATSGNVGSWYFNKSNITSDANPNMVGVQTTLTPGVNYIIRPSASSWNAGVGVGVLTNFQITVANKVGNGQIDFSNNDAVMVGAIPIPQISFTVVEAGYNNHNLDFGFKPGNSIGDRVWFDNNTNGIQDAGELGVPNVNVRLYNSNMDIVATTVTDAHGYWTIPFVPIGTGYFVYFYNKPSNHYWTLAHIGDVGAPRTTGINDSDKDSDVNPDGYTFQFDITSTMTDYKIDAGLSTNMALLNLDVESFTAQKLNYTSQLNFKINKDALGAKYIIERSKSGANNYQPIATINSNGLSDYAYTDTDPFINSANYYRIKLIDLSGLIKYSEIRVLKFEKELNLKVFPNPTTDLLNISINKELVNKPCVIKIYNTDGKLIHIKEIKKATQVESIEVSQLLSGLYIIQLFQNNSLMANTQFVVF